MNRFLVQWIPAVRKPFFNLARATDVASSHRIDCTTRRVQYSATILHIMQLIITGSLIVMISIAVAVTAHAQPSPGPQLKVVEVIWGFDGRVQPGQFNPLSLLIDNQTAESVDGVFTLQEAAGGLSVSGGEYIQQAFLAPAGRRWVQFFPYVSQQYQSSWRLTVNDGNKYRGTRLTEIVQARSAWQPLDQDEEERPQVIILDDANSVTRRPPTVKHFPENIFPPYATATFGLHAVFLDHDPDWEQPRQQAFLTWLKLGGQLHVIQDSRGEFPRFSNALAELNQPLNSFNAGSGTVTRHNLQRDGVTEALVRSVSIRALQQSQDPDVSDSEVVEAQTKLDPSSIDSNFSRELRELTLPEHAWWLIFLLALCYIGLIFPGCFMISRQRQLHFLATYGAIIALSLLFSLLFLLIGRRGYGEATSLHSIAIARGTNNPDLAEWNVMEWNSLFVTAGDNYTVSAGDQQALFSFDDGVERVDAQTVAGNSAEARMRIPPYSAMAFVCRRQIRSSDWELAVENVDMQSSGLVGMTIRTGQQFPVSEQTRYLLMAGRSIYDMRFDKQTRQLVLFGGKRDLGQYCQPAFDYSYNSRRTSLYQSQPSSPDPAQQFFDQSLPSLVSRSLIDDLIDHAAEFTLPADRVRLLVFTDMPESFDLEISAPAKRTGKVLFIRDLLLQNSDF